MVVDYLIGTYTWGAAEGIYLGRLDTETGDFRCEDLVIACESPAFLTGNDTAVYAVNEQMDGGVSAFRRNGTSLAAINTVSSGGALPCHIEIVQNTIVVANYGSGNTAAFPIGDDGSVRACASRIYHPGAGPNAKRQARAHAHQVFPISDDTIWVPDLGCDRVFEYRVENHRLRDTRVALSLPAGHGPRHLVTSATHVYVLAELGNVIDVVDRRSGAIVQSASTLADGDARDGTTAEILKTRAGTVLATNRGENSVVSFDIAADGTLTSPRHVPTLGDHPRFMALDPTESWLIVLNQNADNVVVYAMDNGHPSALACNTSAPTPVCLLEI